MSLDVAQRKRTIAHRQYKETTKEKSRSPPLSKNSWDARGMDEDSCSSSSGDGVYQKDIMTNANAVEDGMQMGVKLLRKTEDGMDPETNTSSPRSAAPIRRPIMERQRSRIGTERIGASPSTRGEQRAGVGQASESPRQPAVSGAEGTVDASEHNSDGSSDMEEDLPTEEEVLAKIEALMTRKHTLFQLWKTKNAEKRRADATIAKTRNDAEELVDTKQDAFPAPANQISAIPTTPTLFANSADGSTDAYATAAASKLVTAVTNQAVLTSQPHSAIRTYPMSFVSGSMVPDDATSETPKPLAAPFHQQLSALGKRQLEAPSPPHSSLPTKRARGGRRHEDPYGYHPRDLGGTGTPRMVSGVPPIVPTSSALNMARRSSAVAQPSVPVPPSVSRPSVPRPLQAPPDRPRGRF